MSEDTATATPSQATEREPCAECRCAEEEPAELLDFVPEILEELEALQQAEDKARDEVKRVQGVIFDRELALSKFADWHREKRQHARDLAEAALSGAAPPPEPVRPEGPSEDQLKAMLTVLQERKKEAEADVARLRGRLRSRICEAVREAVERAGEAYIKSARRTLALHAMIGGGQGVLDRVAPGSPMLVSGEWFREFTIPASRQLRAMERVGAVVGMARAFWPNLVGDGERSQAAAADVWSETHSRIRTRLGGRWPFDKF